MKVYVLILLLPVLANCSSMKKEGAPLYYSKRFKAPYESIWRATQQALLNYPMNINNMDTGQLQTLFITGKHRFQAPHLEKEVLPSGYRYQLNINIVKGEKSSDVTIAKKVLLQKDFFSEPEELESDGFEEKMLLYRIRREIIIEKLQQRELKKQSEQKEPPKKTIKNPQFSQ